MKSNISEDERRGAQVLMPVDEEAILGDQAQQWEEFDAFREQGESSQAGLNVWVYLVPTDKANNPISGARMSLMFTAPIDRYTIPQILERVKKEYMDRGRCGATIRIHVRKERGAGTLWNKLFLILKSAADDEPENKEEPNSGVNALAAAMRDQNQLIAQLISRAQAVPVAPAIDPMLQTERMITMVTGLAGVLSKPTGGVTASASIAEQIAGVREILKLSQSLGGGLDRAGEDEPEGAVGVLKAISPIADLIKELVINARAAPTVPARPARISGPVSPKISGPAPGTVPATAASESPAVIVTPIQPVQSVQPEGDAAMLLKIAGILGEFCALAEAGSDPAVLGETVVSMIPENYDDKFLDILSADNWLERLAAFNPKVRSHPEFFAKLRTAILAQYGDDETPLEADHPPEPHAS